MSSIDNKVAESKKVESLDSLETDNDTRIIILLPKGEDDESKGFPVTYKQSYISDTIKAGIEEDRVSTSIPLDLDKTTVEYVAEFLKYKNGNPGSIVPRPLKRTMKESCIDKWDADFIDKVAKNKQDLHNIYHAADYLVIDTLLHLTGACIALSLRGKTKAEMKELLDHNKKE